MCGERGGTKGQIVKKVGGEGRFGNPSSENSCGNGRRNLVGNRIMGGNKVSPHIQGGQMDGNRHEEDEELRGHENQIVRLQVESNMQWCTAAVHVGSV